MSTPDATEGNPYRIAYGHAARLLEMSRFDHAWGKEYSRRVEPDQIRAVVASQCPKFPPELVDRAVDDALAGRRPRW
jgi:hypothetical protein